MPKNLKFLLVLITVLMLFSCTAEKDRQSSRTESSGDPVREYKLSRYISSHVSGSITPEDVIRIKMVSPLVTADQVGQEETRVSYSFKPSIKGKFIWENLYTLSFIPDSPLKSRSKYTGKFNIAGLIAEQIELEPLNIEFFVVGRELNYYQADLKKASETRDLLQYEGEVGFNLKTGIEELQDGVKLYHGNKILKLDWQQVDTSKNRFSFRSESFLRSDSEAGMKIIFNARKLDLEEDYERSFTLSSLHDMSVILIKKMADEKDPGFVIEFSDEIEPSFDASAYIVIEPEVMRNIQVIGNKINVTGNFEYGKEYHLLIKQGIKNIYAQKSRSDFERIMPFSDLKPQIVFAHDGIFNPTDNKGKIRFRSLNVARVQLKVTRVYANNLCQFLQDVNLESSRKRTEFPVYQMTRVGLEIFSDNLQLGEVYNQWLEHELDLSEVLKSDDQGLYVIHLSFQQKDILYRAPEKGNNWEYYYTDPRRSGYYYRNGTIHKPVIISDIGITCKKQNNSVKIFTNNVLSTSFISNCHVQLKSYQNQTLAEGWTNNQGFCEITLPDQEIFYIEAEKNGQKSIIKLNEMQWNYSTFDAGGVSGETGGIKAFIYTERGVYRPGDEINLNIIIRNEEDTFPDNHPITVIIKNPQRRQVLNETIKVADDGFYHLSFTTKPEDDTGNWEATVIAGNSRFFHELKIETVVAERLRIQIKPEESKIRAERGIFLADLQSSYLFGNPAAGLSARVTAEIFPYTRKWEKPVYRQFTFTDEAMDYQTRTVELFNDKLDQDGSAIIKWDVSSLATGPSPLMTEWQAEVSEPGGRSSKKTIYLPLDPYSYYAGISKLEDKWQRIGRVIPFQFVLLDADGKEAGARDLRVRIYHNSQYWWWEYEQRDKKFHFKTDVETELVLEKKYQTGTDVLDFEFTPEIWGQYLIEVTHLENEVERHSAAQFFNASYWGKLDGGMQNDGLIALAADKEYYHPGDKAEITFPVPKDAAVLVTLEKGDRVIDYSWNKPKKNIARISVPITVEMLPNAYCCISVIQPHDQTDNDRPLRMYGIIPLRVEDPETRQGIYLDVPEKISPSSSFTVDLQTADRKETQFTIAVVDEGLLSLTDFQTPDPWKSFYQKIRLAVSSYDNYSYILGYNKGDVYKSFSVGGGMYEDYKADQTQPEQVERFKATSLFKGPLKTDAQGHASVEFDMPDYIGSVRIMAVAAQQRKYGHAEASVPVKDRLMLLPTLPRMLAPLDKFRLPVEIFRDDPSISEIDIEITYNDLLTVKGKNSKKVIFQDEDKVNVDFEVEVLDLIGEANIKLTARDGDYQVVNETKIAVRPYSARIHESEQYLMTPSSEQTFVVPAKGVSGTNEVTLSLFRQPLPDLEKRIGWLIQYPYGCIEQSTSAAFPQLLLKTMIPGAYLSHSEIDININAMIKRLLKFQHPGGGFTYWPGNNEISEWSSIYAGHFMLEAREQGYSIPREMLDQWLKYESAMVRKNYSYDDPHNRNIMLQVYRCFVLALAKQPETSVMNYLKEDVLNLMDDRERWLLAASYYLIGMDTIAESIRQTTGIMIRDYTEMSGTFGSGYRDKAVILMAMNYFDDDRAFSLYKDICDKLSGNDWLSTQTSGYCLLAAGKYIQAHPADFDQANSISGEIKFPDGSVTIFDFHDFRKDIPVSSEYGNKEVEISISDRTDVDNVFVSMNWSGILLHPEKKVISEGLDMKISWVDESGNPIDPGNLSQGTVFYQKIRVNNLLDRSLENLAFNQILPSGWEIENDRFRGNDYQNNSGKEKNQPGKVNIDYTDIRDDRIYCFFDLAGRNQFAEIEIKLRAVTSGSFELPPAVCEAMYAKQFKAVSRGRKVQVY